MAKSKKSPCKVVAKGGVGETGAASQVVHQVTGKINKLMVLRRGESSLCPNTGALAGLMVDGALMAGGVITAAGSSIQAEAPPGAWVVGLVHTFPLFNDISCVRLGELSFTLEECDLVKTRQEPISRVACMVGVAGIETREWYAWNDLMPPKPDFFHLTGEVQVPNPGVEVTLHPRGDTKGSTINMDLVLTQRAGNWPQVETWKAAAYRRVLFARPYKKAAIYHEGKKIEEVRVQDVQ
jgi:hypothetical protein